MTGILPFNYRINWPNGLGITVIIVGPVKQPVSEFIGVYDADSTLVGEVAYWIGARLGRTHCSLCDLTHGVFTQKSEWKQCTQNLSVPFHTFHRNDAPRDVLAVADGAFPLVLARHGEELRVVLTSSDLVAFHASTADFAVWLESYLTTHSISN